jgi:tetratricopeptide (TPR) repeat protein
MSTNKPPLKPSSEQFRTEKAMKTMSSLNALGRTADSIAKNQDFLGGLFGDSASSANLAELFKATKALKHNQCHQILTKAYTHFQKRDFDEGGRLALEALAIDERCGEAWHFLAIAREKASDLNTAFTAYETALSLLPENLNIASDLGRLAYRLGHYEISERFFAFVLDKNPDHIESINNLASALRETEKHDSAIALLQDALARHPNNAQLWNTIGTVMTIKGEVELARLFFEECLKNDPKHVHGLHNLGNLYCTLGMTTEGRGLLEKTLGRFEDMINQSSAKLSIAFSYLFEGNLKEGFVWYQARHKENTFEQLHYLTEAPHLSSDCGLPSTSLFVTAEQGLGDEIMMASLIPDLIANRPTSFELGIGVEERLVGLFQRSFPKAQVFAHKTVTQNGHQYRFYPDVQSWQDYEKFGLMADLLPRFRQNITDFPDNNVFLKPDPSKVLHWKEWLVSLGPEPKIGLVWKSAIMHSRRSRHFSPFDNWKPILNIPGKHFINLQYGDCDEELAKAKSDGIVIHQPPLIDLKNDLDGVAALCFALDLVMGPANATLNIAAACGVPVFSYSELYDWTKLGSKQMPWYPSMRCFIASKPNEWSDVMESMAEALRCNEFQNIRKVA